MRLKAILLWLVIGVSHHGVVAHAGAVEDAETALRAGRPAIAQALLVGFQPKTTVDQKRADWVLALALLRQNQTAQAIPLLERLVAHAPDKTRMRLELARAYFLTGQDDAARRQFNMARAGTLATGEAEAIDSFVAKIDQRKTSESYFRFALIPETNAVRRTAAETITLASRTYVLNNRAKAGTGIRLGFGHTATPQLAPGWRGRFGVHVDGRLYADKSITSSALRFEAGIARSVPGDTRVGAGLLGEITGLAGRMYSTATGGYLSFSTLVGRADGRSTAGYGEFSARVELMDLRYPDYRFSNGARSTLSLDYRHAVSPRFAVSAGVVVARANAQSVSERSWTRGLTLGVDYAFDGGLVIGATLTRAKMTRDAASGLFTVARKDDLTVLGLRFYHTDVQIRGFAPTLEITAEQRTSNIVLNAYKNLGLSIGFTRRF